MSAIYSAEIDTLNTTFAALSDPTRRAMLTRLSQSEASVNELAAPFNMSLPAVSKHIKVLEKAGLLTKTIRAQQRPCKIDGLQLKQAADWLYQFATNNITLKSINTPATANNSSKRQAKSPKSPKPTVKPQEKSDVNSDLQQQIGFDF